jgi:hypothetical protein
MQKVCMYAESHHGLSRAYETIKNVGQSVYLFLFWKFAWGQGDQIGRIFAYGRLFALGSLFTIMEVSPIFGPPLYTVQISY